MSLINNIASWLLSSKEAPKGSKQFLNWSQLSNVLIVAHDHQLSNVVDFINACKKDTIHVHVAVVYDGKPDQTPKPNFEHTILDKKQFNFFGLPSEQAIQTLSLKPIDALINLGNVEQIKTFAISKLTSAKCKIGSFQDSVYDITIDVDASQNVSKFLEQVIVYLHMIKTTK